MDSQQIYSKHQPTHSYAQSYAQCVCAAVRRANRAITQLYDAVLAPTGLKATQFVLLHAIGAHGCVAQWQLADDNAMATETLSRRLSSLRRKHLVELTIGEHHGEHMYRLTGEGRQALDAALPSWQRAQDRLQQVFADKTLEDIVGFANQLTRAASQAQELKTMNLSSVRGAV
jgi:DNA-binding MarR family transcriptional regulator